MGLFSRFKSVIKAKTSAVLEKLEDPEEQLDYAYEQLIEERKRIDRAVRDSIADRNLIRNELEEHQRQMERAFESAKKYRTRALQLQEKLGDKEDPDTQQKIHKLNEAAMKLLMEKLKREERVKDLSIKLEKAEVRINSMKEKRIDLKAKLEDLRAKKEELKSEWRMAKAEERIAGALTGIGGDFSDVSLTLERMEEKVKRKKALAAATADVAELDKDVIELEAEAEKEMLAEVSLEELDRELLAEGKIKMLAPGKLSSFLIAISGGGTWAFPAEHKEEILKQINELDDELTELNKKEALTPEKFNEIYPKIFKLIREKGKLVGRDIDLASVLPEGQPYAEPEVKLPPEDLEYDEALALFQGKGLIAG